MPAIAAALRPTVIFLLLSSLLFGVVYPAAVTPVLQLLFPKQAQGGLIADKEGKIIGAELIGQHFSKPQYFWGRLSATAPFPYNAAASGGSNLSNANPALLAAAEARIKALAAHDPANQAPIPVDLVTASGSGLDPHISVAAANYQARRVARARRMKEADVNAMIANHTEGRQFGVLGEPRVNVLMLNLALDGKP